MDIASRTALTLSCCSLMAIGHAAMGATLCVNPGGSAGCAATIGAAVTAAKAGDRIDIAPGQYSESVVVTKPLSLVGAGSDSTFINARGLSTGVYVNGLDNPGLSGILITGLTVMNANFEGILVTNSSYVMISNNHVTGNAQNLNIAAGKCPGLPVFETSEDMDCGEGIHLMGVDHSTVANNIVDNNSGGMLLSDETGITHNNLVTGNHVHDNAYACGITMASHPPSPAAASKLPYGISSNTISGNVSSHNGHAGSGGAGIGIFAPGPGNLNFGNRIVGNTLANNGHPGVTMHNHALPPGAPGINLNDTMIVGNYISGNGADTADAATPGTAGIDIFGVGAAYGILIAENTIVNEAVDVVMNNPGTMEVHSNNLLGLGIAISNAGAGSVNASMNYMGCEGGPGTMGCSTIKGTVTSSPSLAHPVASAPPAGRLNGRP